MRSPRKTTAIILAGAAGLASVAYGLGTQTDGGSASAARDNGSQADWRDGRPPGFNGLAKKLGVSAAELREALEAFHEEKEGDGRDGFASALAEALGKPVDEVQAAFDSIADNHKARFAAKLAKALGVEAADVEAALEELKDERPDDPGDFPAALAEKLGVEAADVEAALENLRSDWRGGPRGDHHGMSLRRLAAALDVTRAELRKALKEVRSGADERIEDGRADLVKFLAERFNLSEEKVEAALPDFAGMGPGGPHGPGGFGGPGGPGGPGGFGGPGGPGGPGGFGGPGGPGGFGGP